MVSLPTLKTQFKHLSEVMTALYSENSTFAQNFLIDENGIVVPERKLATHSWVAFKGIEREHLAVGEVTVVGNGEQRTAGSEFIETQLSEHCEGVRFHHTRIWAMLMLELWYQMWIDPPAGQIVPKPRPANALSRLVDVDRPLSAA